MEALQPPDSCNVRVPDLTHAGTPCAQVNGHFMATLDPLGLDQRPTPVELDPALYGFTDKDMDRE